MASDAAILSTAAAPDSFHATVAEKSAARIHVVHEGDRLDRLAKRYLGDESRALELFDLNRDVLTNPHLLPIGTELRIPAVEKTAR
ncbi:MAG: LysM peptidoglycan-binding domain-containing protein [Pirellulales bacterium]|nr:LysM peptidoglycan-binding domain-containing protein [Pirellulales bacterium]